MIGIIIEWTIQGFVWIKYKIHLIYYLSEDAFKVTVSESGIELNLDYFLTLNHQAIKQKSRRQNQQVVNSSCLSTQPAHLTVHY